MVMGSLNGALTVIDQAQSRANLGLGDVSLLNLPIGNGSLQNSSVTINTSGNLTGGGSVSLGGSLNLVGTGGNGDVFGPASSLTGNLAIFGDLTGKLIADSGIGVFSTYLVGCGGIVDSLTPTVTFGLGSGQFNFTADTSVSFSVSGANFNFTSTLMEVDNAVSFKKSFGLGFTGIISTPYVVVDGTDCTVEVDLTPATVQLPDAPILGTIFIIKDASGSATPVITVTTVSGIDLIDDSTSKIMTSPNASMIVQFNGAKYIILASTGMNGTYWQAIGASQTLVANSGFLCTSGAGLSLALPSTATVGDIIEIGLNGSTSFTITQGASQTIRIGNVSTTVGIGGSLASTAQGDSLKLICTTANTGWMVLSSVGNLTVV